MNCSTKRYSKARLALTRQLFLALSYFTARMNRDAARLTQVAQRKMSVRSESPLTNLIQVEVVVPRQELAHNPD